MRITTFILYSVVIFQFFSKGNAKPELTLNSVQSKSSAQSLKEKLVPTQKETMVKIVFSDVDGTLVHYPSEPRESEEGNKIISLPASSTGMRGIISSKTLTLCQELRRMKNTKLVLVSGMRTSTLIKRLPYLPKADAYASEGGGRIFYCDEKPTKDDTCIIPVQFDGATDEDLKHFTLREDENWRKKMSDDGAGSDGYKGDAMDVFLGKQKKDSKIIPLNNRNGRLWDFARDLQRKGFVIDYNGYTNSFRVNKKQQTKITDDEFQTLNTMDFASYGLGSSVNLGCVDFYPETSGKKNCCGYLASYFNKQKVDIEELLESCICLCDDDNDLEMADACGRVFLPSISSTSMQEAASRSPNKISIVEDMAKSIFETSATEVAISSAMTELMK